MKDEIVIALEAGHGGHGCVSFRREKYLPRGGPDGGDGGDGGDVFLYADGSLTTFDDVSHPSRIAAGHGRPGEGSLKTGKRGDDLRLAVPPGTLVVDVDRGHVLKDLDRAGEEVRLLRGGHGGRGNKAFATSTDRAPRRCEEGTPGEHRTVRLTLKLIADVGLVGLPNAGKSTLLRAISSASPKVASYPFTTLAPHLGIVELDLDTRFVVADIPGIIEGAHEGSGLGLRFLRHIERTRLLLHLVDGSPDAELEPAEAYRLIRGELEAYGHGLADRDEMVVLTKQDRSDPAIPIKHAFGNSDMKDVHRISAVTGEGVGDLLRAAARRLGLGPIDPD